MSDLFDDNGANFSPCRKYRFYLWRIWDKTKPCVMFIGLNPSTANETKPDPTITRVMGFAKDWGFGGVYMMNCFPYVSTDPNDLTEHGNTEENDYLLEKIGTLCSKVIFAWGAFPIVSKLGRDKELQKMFPQAEALILNANGSPRHPLYVPAHTIPAPFKVKEYLPRKSRSK